MLDLCFDPQTSGGLLIAVAESAAGELLGQAARGGHGRGGDHRQRAGRGLRQGAASLGPSKPQRRS